MQDRNSGYFPHIDGMRAIAVLAVIVYHLKANWLPGGFTGVDVFFVISGFVVSASVDRLPAIGGWAGLLRFYARRMRRIAPALVVCLLVTAAFSALLIPESWLSETSDKTGRMAFLGLSNWVLASTGNDYFSPKTEFNPYTHTWSLGVEEQFYLLFPLLFLAWPKGLGGRRISLGLFAVATGASLLYAVFRAHQGGHEIDAFYLTTTRFWQLGAGVLLFQLLSLAGRFNPPAAPASRLSWRSPLLLASLCALGYGLWAARPGHSPWVDGLWPVLGALGGLGLLQQSPGGLIGRALSTPPMVIIGRMSYSLYLWHWPVFVLFRWTVGLDSVTTGASALLCVLVLSWLSWRWVEQPLRHGTRWKMSNTRWVGLGLTVLVMGAAAQTVLVRTQKYTSLSVVSRAPLDWYPYADGLKREYPDCRIKVSYVPVASGEARLYERDRCPGRPTSSHQLFVAGDSHALAYHEMLQRLAVLEGGTSWLYSSGGCALVGLQGWHGSNPACDAYVRDVLKDIHNRAKPGDVVLLAGLRLPRLSEQYALFDHKLVWAAQFNDAAAVDRAAEVDHWIAELRPLTERGIRIVLEAPKPLLPAPPYRCSDVFNRNNPICINGMTISRRDIEELRSPVLTGMQKVAAAVPGVTIWDPLPRLCPGSVCLPTHDGHPLYFDGDHLSGYGNRLLLPDFQAHLRSIERVSVTTVL